MIMSEYAYYVLSAFGIVLCSLGAYAFQAFLHYRKKTEVMKK